MVGGIGGEEGRRCRICRWNWQDPRNARQSLNWVLTSWQQVSETFTVTILQLAGLSLDRLGEIRGCYKR